MPIRYATLILLILLVACQNREAFDHTSINGVWESIGSGWILDIRDSSSFSFYDLTPISCLPAPSSAGDFQELSPDLKLQNDTLFFFLGMSTDQFIRKAQLPELCGITLDPKMAHDPNYNFEVFAETVKEHYAFFELNSINWDEMYQEQKAKLSDKTTNAELYLLIEETLEKLNDNHAFLEAPDSIYDAIDELSIEAPETSNGLPEYGDLPVAEMVAKHHLQEVMTEDSWLIEWGMMTDEIGFIQIKTMWLYADIELPQALKDSLGFVDAFIEMRHRLYEGDYIRKEVQAVSKIMDRVLRDLMDSKSIVIDVRFNGGGQDAVSAELISRFIPEELHFAGQKIRYGNKFTPTVQYTIDPAQNAYTRPIYVLTSPQSGSAAEVFAAGIREMPNARSIGSATMGAMSTTLDKTLPNGWIFSISNEILMDKEGMPYENRGVPVDFELNYPRNRQAFFRSVVDDLEGDRENVLKAIESLKE